jgi:hypothetical protein
MRKMILLFVVCMFLLTNFASVSTSGSGIKTEKSISTNSNDDYVRVYGYARTALLSPVEGAKIRIMSGDHPSSYDKTKITDSDGYYEFTDVPVLGNIVFLVGIAKDGYFCWSGSVFITTQWGDDQVVNFVLIKKPRSRVIDTPFLNFLENHPNMFPILRLYLRGMSLEELMTTC